MPKTAAFGSYTGEYGYGGSAWQHDFWATVLASRVSYAPKAPMLITGVMLALNCRSTKPKHVAE